MEQKTHQQMTNEFIEIVKPVIKWMAENQHPHTKLIIDSKSAELLEGILISETIEFIKD